MGRQATAGAQQLFARILACLYFTVVFSEKVYQGMKRAMMIFETVVGHSFKCVSEQSLQLSTHLQLKTMNVQLQAFDFEDDHFGNGELCHKHTSEKVIILDRNTLNWISSSQIQAVPPN